MPLRQAQGKPDLRPLQLTDNDLDALAEVTEADILAAWQAWRAATDRRYVNLLTAQPDAEGGERADSP